MKSRHALFAEEAERYSFIMFHTAGAVRAYAASENVHDPMLSILGEMSKTILPEETLGGALAAAVSGLPEHCGQDNADPHPG